MERAARDFHRKVWTWRESRGSVGVVAPGMQEDKRRDLGRPHRLRQAKVGHAVIETRTGKPRHRVRPKPGARRPGKRYRPKREGRRQRMGSQTGSSVLRARESRVHGCCRSRSFAEPSRKNPRLIYRIPPPLLARIVALRGSDPLGLRYGSTWPKTGRGDRPHWRRTVKPSDTPTRRTAHGRSRPRPDLATAVPGNGL